MATVRSSRLAPALAGIALAVLAACSEPSPRGGGPSPSPTATTFEEAEWSVTTPAGWTREDVTASVDATKAIRYQGSSGEYFVVAIDPSGSDFGSDEIWRYEVSGDGFRIVERIRCDGATNQTCTDDDSRYDVYVLWRANADPPRLAGHTWYFILGDASGTAIDAGRFEAIVESVRVND